MSKIANQSEPDYTQCIHGGNLQLKEGRPESALKHFLKAASLRETVAPTLCLKIARLYFGFKDYQNAGSYCLRVAEDVGDFTSWLAASQLISKKEIKAQLSFKRSIKLAILGSYTTSHLTKMLALIGAQQGIEIDLYESQYAQYRQEILDPGSHLYAFDPDFILLAVHEGEIALKGLSANPKGDLELECQRWTNLWQFLQEQSRAHIIQHNFVVSTDAPMGHLATRVQGSKYQMTQRLNLELAGYCGRRVSIVDCDRLASQYGKGRWFDPRYWNLAKTALSIEAMPVLASHTLAVIAAELGLSKKCLVLDLDNTLWGGVVGEDGLANLKLGSDANGEAFVDFQKYILSLQEKGVVLAVCSKNNEKDAQEPFEKHPEMLIRLEHIACFVANWEPKPENLRKIAKELNLGLDSLVFVDDNPAERSIVRQFLPAVDVLDLPKDPAYYKSALSDYPWFETSSFTTEDTQRTAQYQARSKMEALKEPSQSIEDFYRSLEMQADIHPFDAINLPRIVQLIGKTNQFNLTTKRHNTQAVEAFMEDPNCIHLYMRIKDQFTDHGLVSVIIALRNEDILEIDTWLMSCRVIGRTAENAMLSVLTEKAKELDCIAIKGVYIPTEKNVPVKNLFRDFGFSEVEAGSGEEAVWIYDLKDKGLVTNDFINILEK
ncbi:MAG: methoxymalonyl-ACP biosynthesis protein FkbH [Thiothrix sp.]|nr:MAG: methoxymalonyl-ACP biosynthesis protein FkbH [Thiothrix sp.]